MLIGHVVASSRSMPQRRLKERHTNGAERVIVKVRRRAFHLRVPTMRIVGEKVEERGKVAAAVNMTR